MVTFTQTAWRTHIWQTEIQIAHNIEPELFLLSNELMAPDDAHTGHGLAVRCTAENQGSTRKIKQIVISITRDE